MRSFEIVSEVCNSWLADKTVNMLMAKKTPLAAKLSRAVSSCRSAVDVDLQSLSRIGV